MNLQCLTLLLLCGWTCSATNVTMGSTRFKEECISQTESSSLTYLVDTTGSMSDDLEQLKKVNDWILDRVSAQLPCSVRQYTMVEFNDPTIGPVRVTHSRSDFGDFFQNLYASGGDDCPELAMEGLELALEASPDNSLIVVLTDASAKDYNNQTIIDNIYSLISTKHSKVMFLLTGLCSNLDDPQFLIYRDIALLSFGHVFQVSVSEIGKIFYYLDYTLSRPVNTSIQLYSAMFTGGFNSEHFSVSNSFTSLIVSSDGIIYSLTIIGPNDTVTDTKKVVSERWGSVYLVRNPMEGTWTINVTGEGRHSVNVEGMKVMNTSTVADCSECHPNATCEELFGNKECSCNDGFIGNGFTCADIDECAYSWSNNCSHTCTNTFGSYICNCASGYKKNVADFCIDIDECSDHTLNACHSLAICTNTIGSFSCSCPYGYYGNGFHCEINECTTHLCPQDTDCYKEKGSYSCFDPCSKYTSLDEPWRSTSNTYGYKCDNYMSGWYRFVGTGGIRMPETCVPELHCSTNFPMWVSGSHPMIGEGIVNATACLNFNSDCCHGSTDIQIKACPLGYHVYKFSSTPFCNAAYCTDPATVNELCSCANDEECRLVNGSYSCHCKDGREALDIEDVHLDLVCNTHEITASFRTCQLKRLNLNVTNIHLLDNTCVGNADWNNTGIISVISPLQDGICGNQLYNNGTHATYKNTMYVKMISDLIIVRYHEVQLDFSCSYPLDLNLTLEHSLRPIISSITLNIEGTGQFKAQMVLYRDDSYLSPYQGNEIILSTKNILYVGVILEGENTSQYVVLMKNCFATPTRSIDDPVKYYMIKNKCPNRKDGTIRVMENGLSTQGRFSVQMFKFVGDYNLVYLHCEASICDTTRGSCQPSCSGLRKSVQQNEENIVFLDYGPIRLSDEGHSQSSNAVGTRACWTLLLTLLLLCIKN
ncbi:uromodulin-like [Pseudophryne corroboree]|uniref:uromodulin-like n=1 Tax=Pseudophryne corroboree TaxID=495146 RepID=UPI0030812923